MAVYYAYIEDDPKYALSHHGVKDQRCGIRRWQNEDGSLTPAGREHYRYSTTARDEYFKNKSKENRAKMKRERLENYARQLRYKTDSKYANKLDKITAKANKRLKANESRSNIDERAKDIEEQRNKKIIDQYDNKKARLTKRYDKNVKKIESLTGTGGSVTDKVNRLIAKADASYMYELDDSLAYRHIDVNKFPFFKYLLEDMGIRR